MALSMSALGLLVLFLQVAVVLFVVTIALRFVRAVEGVERSIARAVAHYERSSP